MILAGLMPSFSARSLTVTPDSTLTGPGRHLRLALGLGPRPAPLAALAGPAAGLGIDHHAPAAAGLGASLGACLAGRLTRLLGGHGGLGAERLAHVLVVDQLVSIGGAAGRIQLLLDLSLCDALLSGDIGHRFLRHRSSILPNRRPLLKPEPFFKSCCGLSRHPQPPRQRLPAQCLLGAFPLRTQIGAAPGKPFCSVDHDRATIDCEPDQLGLFAAPAAARALPDRGGYDAAAPSSLAASSRWAGTPQ